MRSVVMSSLQEESVNVKDLRAKFSNQAITSDTSSRDSNSPKSPRPGFGRAYPPFMDNNLTHRPEAAVSPTFAGPGQVRLPRVEPMAVSISPRPASFPRPLNASTIRASVQPGDANKVKQTGELLQNKMLRYQKLPGTNLAPSPVQSHAPSPVSTPRPLRQQSHQRSLRDVSPLRKPLPSEQGHQPSKPKRPPHVNLEPFLKFKRGAATSASNRHDGSSDRRMSLPTVMSPPQPPLRSSKPNRLPRQIASVDIEDEQDPYDDVGSFEKSGSYSDNNSQSLDGDDDDVYESIDEDQIETNHLSAAKTNMKDAKRQTEYEKKENLKKQNELKKNFQIQGEIQVLHTARVRYDWKGEGKLDLSVQQGENIEILRVENNPRGKWLARSMTGNYGYISNTCVDIDYEAVKRKLPQLRNMETSFLPPPPPDPPRMLNVASQDSLLSDDDDYDDVQPIPDEFPPPPPEINIDPKVEKELKKKFKFEGPIRVLQTMMVDPNCVIKKLGAKDLQVTQGEIVEIIDQSNKKKYLCRNSFGNYGYVSSTFLLHLEGDVYDDVDYPCEVYDNDSPAINY